MGTADVDFDVHIIDCDMIALNRSDLTRDRYVNWNVRTAGFVGCAIQVRCPGIIRVLLRLGRRARSSQAIRAAQGDVYGLARLYDLGVAVYGDAGTAVHHSYGHTFTRV